MNLALVAGAIGIQAVNRLLAGATLTMYSGTQPATPETALSGNTSLVVFTFSTPAFGTPSHSGSNETATASFVSASVNPASNGTVSFARATLNAAAWTATHAYTYGTIVSNAGSFFVCVGAGTSAGSGGPSTTGEGIADGTVMWNFIGATTGQGNVVADYTCGTSGTDIVLGSTTITTGVPVNITSFTQSIPVV